MKTLKFLSMAALAMVGAVMTSCSSSSDFDEAPAQPASTGNAETLTITVSRGGDTRALAADGTKTFSVDDKIAVVYKNTSGTTVKAESEALKAGDITEGGVAATFTVTLTDADKLEDVTYIYPAAMAKDNGDINYDALASQDGTLDNLSSNLDLATCTAAWNGASLPTGTLNNELAILALTLKDEAGTNDITSSITGLTLSDGTYNYAVTRSAAAGPIYVAIRPTSSAGITITATDGNFSYTKSLTDKTYAANNGYNVSWRMVFDALSSPLTFEAKTAGATMTFTKGSSVTLDDIEYNVYDGNGWKTYTYGTGITLTNVGDKVSFRGDNARYATNYYNYQDNIHSTISCTADCYIYGNIMSLVNSTNYVNAKKLTGTYTFSCLFLNNTHIVDHPSKTLVLPATTLTQFCYCYMFNGCTSLTTAPALPATTLADHCYHSMFEGCTSLTTAPALPTTTLKTWCCYRMFYGCTGLTTAPDLPTTTLAEYCYREMFQNCTNLTTAPTLPATTLAKYCYREMFQNCTNLSSVTCLATNISANGCTTNWLNGVAASGTFTTPSSTSWSTGSSGIPSGWTRVNAQ